MAIIDSEKYYTFLKDKKPSDECEYLCAIQKGRFIQYKVCCWSKNLYNEDPFYFGDRIGIPGFYVEDGGYLCQEENVIAWADIIKLDHR